MSKDSDQTQTAPRKKTLAAIMNDPHAPDAARIAAAEALLDVGWGKPRHEAEITFEEIHEQRFRPNPNSA
jgi:hypothetical protein